MLNKKLNIIENKNKIRFNEKKVEYCDNSKLKKLNWSPKVDFVDGLEICKNDFYEKI